MIKDILDRAEGLQRQLMSSGQTTPALLASQASALNQIAITLVQIGNAADGYDAADRARQISEELTATKPDNVAWKVNLAISYSRMGLALQRQDKFAEALAAYKKGLEIDQKLVAADPGINDGLQNYLATSFQKVGDAYGLLRNYDESLRAYQESLAIWKRIAEKKPDDRAAQFSLAVGNRKLAIGLDSVGKSAASVEPYRAAAATLETLVTNDSGNSQWQNELAVVYGGLGEIFIRQGLGDEALDVTRKCLALLQKLADGDPDNGELQAALTLTNERIGDVLDREGKLSDALDAYRRNLAIEQRLADHEPGNGHRLTGVSNAYAKIGNVLIRQDKLAEAQVAYEP